MKTNLLKPIILLLALQLCPFLIEAKHIVGGDFSYRYVGPGSAAGTKRWHFTMNVYRDANSGSQAAPLDPDAVISIYEEFSSTSFLPVPGFATFTVPLQNLGKIPVDLASPCLTAPPDVQVERGLYEFEIDLKVSPNSYHIIYQRCCRNVTINNIATPGDVGATFSVELTGQAQQLSNNGPTFKNFPPVAICANLPLVFDHSAVDVDGDVLKYSLCAPLTGGGPDLNGPAAQGCNGASPDPACPPPFTPVVFVAPFSASQPMAGNPAVTINPNTGIISGKPQILGQFVVGVCVEEYRNGVLISVLRRDFQFNVVDCQPTVLADIQEDSLTGLNTYKVISCGSTTLTIKNESFYKNNIDNWYWIFDLKGVKDSLPGTSADFNKNWDATVMFPDTGNYHGFLVLNPGTICGDTAEVVVKIRPDIKASFIWEQDPCVRGLTRFTDRTESGGGPIQYWEWTTGDGMTTLGKPSFDYIYSDENDHNVRLFVVDTSGCRDSLTIPVPYLKLNQLAAFDWTPKELNSFQKTVTFIDQSLNPVKWKWQFDKFGASSIQNPVFEFPDTGMITVKLYITDDRGCRDSVEHRFDIVPFISWFMPNAFTPNDDGSNDTFFGKGILDGATKFNFSIWNRWGEKVFETDNPETGWNGRKENTGKLVPNGVYVYLVTFTGPRGDPFEYKGFATVVR